MKGCILLLLVLVVAGDNAQFHVITKDVTSSPTYRECAKQFNLQICQVHVKFTKEPHKLVAVGYSDIKTDAPRGFHKALDANGKPYLTWKAVSSGEVGLMKELVCDSYVTLGPPPSPQGTRLDYDGTAHDPDFKAGANQISGGWYHVPPPNPATDYFIAQLAVAKGSKISGEFRVYHSANQKDVFQGTTQFSCFGDSSKLFLPQPGVNINGQNSQKNRPNRPNRPANNGGDTNQQRAKPLEDGKNAAAFGAGASVVVIAVIGLVFAGVYYTFFRPKQNRLNV